jgi:hypothetical protein
LSPGDDAKETDDAEASNQRQLVSQRTRLHGWFPFWPFLEGLKLTDCCERDFQLPAFQPVTATTYAVLPLSQHPGGLKLQTIPTLGRVQSGVAKRRFAGSLVISGIGGQKCNGFEFFSKDESY